MMMMWVFKGFDVAAERAKARWYFVVSPLTE